MRNFFRTAAPLSVEETIVNERLEIMRKCRKKAFLPVILSVVLMLSLATAAIAASGEAAEGVSPINMGDHIHFGGLVWVVLDVQDGKALVLSDRIIAQGWYYPDSYVQHKTWAESDMRRFLNEEFFHSAFTAEEREQIVETTVVTGDNPLFTTPGGEDTIDKVFLLSLEEVLHYSGSTDALNEATTKKFFISDPNNPMRIAETDEGNAAWWWLRSPGAYDFLCHTNFCHAAVVLANGSLTVFGEMVGNEFGGVRPAMWIYLSAANTDIVE